MRLPADKVKAAIMHSDREVRDAAVEYFANSFSPDPNIMPMVIRAIEKFGFESAFRRIDFLSDLVQTNETVWWLLQQLRMLDSPADEKEAKAYLSALVSANASILQRHEREIMALESLDEITMNAITERIWFLSRPANDLWQELEEFCQANEGMEGTAFEEFGFACRIVEALSRHRDQLAGKVMAILQGDTDDADTWIEGMALRLAGEMKLDVAIPSLMSFVADDTGDWRNEECSRALKNIGNDVVVAWFADDCPQAEWFLRLEAAGILETIHTDLSVQTCLDLLRTETDQPLQEFWIHSALASFATEAIEPARQFLVNTLLDPDVLNVRRHLLIACKLMGQRFPEFDAWWDDSKNDDEHRRNWYADHPWRARNKDDEDEDDFEEDFYEDEFEEPERP